MDQRVRRSLERSVWRREIRFARKVANLEEFTEDSSAMPRRVGASMAGFAEVYWETWA
jgi:hypothetical protein